MKKDDGKTLTQLTKQVNQTIEISDILAGKKPIGGKIGKQLNKLQEEETSLTKGKKLRSEKFKAFDDYLDRMEIIANDNELPDKRRIKIKRAIILDPKNPDKVI